MQVVVAVAGRHRKTGEIFAAWTGKNGTCRVTRVGGTAGLRDVFAHTVIREAVRELVRTNFEFDRLGELYAAYERERKACEQRQQAIGIEQPSLPLEQPQVQEVTA